MHYFKMDGDPTAIQVEFARENADFLQEESPQGANATKAPQRRLVWITKRRVTELRLRLGEHFKNIRFGLYK